MTGFKISVRQRAAAKAQRREQTTIEGLVWRELRAKRFHGLKFKRQVPIGPFIADFACFEAKLIVEVDGRITTSLPEENGIDGAMPGSKNTDLRCFA